MPKVGVMSTETQMIAPSPWQELVVVVTMTVMVEVVEIGARVMTIMVVGAGVVVEVVVKEAEPGVRCRRCLPPAVRMCPRTRRT